ncbi:hypothetical protein [Sandarakinorhabdus sp. AAP62]|uniref:hypothetical protein n=1 Tax=Sandarakinorhabdus sp. AAP62 TaxID=1248916 RepID=UPI0012678201|nr:hypothetical protein [Sandarakinorhabdus sp. AAP62]
MESIVQLVGIIVTAIVANKGLGVWEDQKIGSKRIEIAEDLFISFLEFKQDVIYITNGVVWNNEISNNKDELEKLVPAEYYERCISVFAYIKRREKRREKLVSFFTKKHLAYAYFGKDIYDLYDRCEKLFNEISVGLDMIWEHQSHYIGRFDREFYNSLDELVTLGLRVKHPKRIELENIAEEATKIFHKTLGLNIQKKLSWREWLWG